MQILPIPRPVFCCFGKEIGGVRKILRQVLQDQGFLAKRAIIIAWRMIWGVGDGSGHPQLITWKKKLADD